jgi:hypothetical protein
MHKDARWLALFAGADPVQSSIPIDVGKHGIYRGADP